MAVTTEEQTQILNLVVGMFNATPGAANLAAINSMYETNGNSLTALADSLGTLDLFTEQFTDLDDAAASALIISYFGLTAGTTAGDIATTYVQNELEVGTSKQQIIKNAVDYFTNGTADSIFSDAVDNLENKTVVSEYYSVTQGRSANTIEELKAIIETVTSAIATKTAAIAALQISDTVSIQSVTIPDGNYTYGADINIEVTFNNPIIISGTDSTLTLMLGDVEKKAVLYSYTDNSLLYKYVVEDGYFSTSQTVLVPENSISLNSTTVQDNIGLNIDLSFESADNSLAIITDVQEPKYTLYNAHYDTDANKITINGIGFETLLEYNESSTTDITNKIDFTKIIWDFDSDDAGTTNTVFNLDAANISSSKVESDNLLSLVITDATLLETDTNYDATGGADSLDILQGFLLDTVGNISTTATQNDLLLGVDNLFLGDTNTNTLYGTLDDDVIVALDGNDIIYAKDGNDTISGGIGDDIIYAGTGIDIITGDAGADTFVFVKNDSLPLFDKNFGIDTISDLTINSNTEDLIDLDVSITAVNNSVSGEVNEATFISDINTLVSVVTNGFNVLKSNDISASIVSVTSGDLSAKKYLAVDYNANNSFDSGDFIIEITGASITNLNTLSFV